MAKCSKCGREVPAGTKFCPGCGYRQATDPDGVNFVVEDPSAGDSTFEQAISSKGRYAIKRLLGRGGMGLVYHAVDSELGIEVAIKSLPPELSNDPRGLNQLKQEAKLSMQLTHQNIVRLFDLKEADNTKYLVMEYVPGFNLSEYLLMRGKLKEEEAWDILRQVAAALDYAHSQKVIHRDIKPGNILFKTSMTAQEFGEYFQREGKFPSDVEIKVADFGIARTISDSMSRMSNMPISGTLSYMSREQVRGKTQTHKTDIYSLAVVAYELLNGNPPFHQGEITYQILNEEPEPIAGVKPEYMTAILNALSKDPEERPASVSEFMDLPQKLRFDPELMARLSAPKKPVAEQEAPAEQPLASDATDVQAAAKDEQRIYWSIGIALAILVLSLGSFGVYKHFRPGNAPGKRSGKTISKPGTPPENPPVQTAAAELLWKAGKNSPGAHMGRVNAVALNPAGTIVASAGEDKTVKLWNAKDGSLIKTLKGSSAAINSLAFSPGGAVLASAGADGNLKLWSIPGGYLIRNIHAGPVANCVRFSPDGASLAAASIGAVKLFKVSSGEPIKTLKAKMLITVISVAFSPNGKTLAAAGKNYIISFWDLDKGDSLKTIYGAMPASATDIDFSPGGGILATAGSENVRLWNTSTGKPAGVLEGHKKNVTAVSFSNNGNLASASTDGTIRLWKGSNGASIGSVETHSAYSVSFVGNLLASGGCPEPGAFSCATGEVRLYKVK